LYRIFIPFFLLTLLLGSPAGGEVVYLCFGDSITDGSFDTRKPRGYPNRMEKQLLDLAIDARAENHGKGGETTGEGLSRIDKVLDEGGDILLLMEGTNDISRGVSVETTLFNLSEMASRAAEREILPVYATVIPRAPWANVDSSNKINGRLAANLRAQATLEGYRIVDTYAGFFALPGLFDNYYYDSQDDPVGHPNTQGYDVLADIFVPVAIAAADDISGDLVHGSLAFESPGYLMGESMGSVTVAVTRSGGAFGAVTVEVVLSDLVSTVSFAHGEAGKKELVLTVEDDDQDQGDRELILTLENPVGGAVLGEPASSSLTIVEDDVTPGPCLNARNAICLNEDRFRCRVHWRDFQGAVGLATVDELRSADSGLLWFFEETNWEMLLKVLDGCEVNGHVWVFAAAATSVEYVLTVSDMELGFSRQYSSQLGVSSATLTDTQAFAESCP
jgi:lysophospholipase L1-like esterase